MKYLLTFSFVTISIILFAQERIETIELDTNKLQFEWERTEVISNSVTDESTLLIKVSTGLTNLNLSEFILFINGDSINNTKNRQFQNKIFSAEIPLVVGVNDIYVLYQNINTSVLRIIYKPKRHNLSLFSAGISSESSLDENAFDFSNLFEKQFLLYRNRNYIVLDDEKVNYRKIKQGQKSLKKQYLATTVQSENDVIVSYISSFALIRQNVLRLKDINFNIRKTEKSTFTINSMMDKILPLNCQKVLFLDIQLDEDYSERELELIKEELSKKAKKEGFTLFAALENQSDFKLKKAKKTTFTNILVEALSIKADKNHDKIISTAELADYLENQQLSNLVVEVKSDFSLVTIE